MPHAAFAIAQLPIEVGQIVLGALLVFGGAILLALLVAVVMYGRLWLQAYFSGADVTLLSLIGMGFRQVSMSMIVQAKVMVAQAGLDVGRKHGISTAALEAQYLAGGNVLDVVKSIIIANRAGIHLDFDRAAAIDLAGRDILDAVRTSVLPRVINVPALEQSSKRALSAVAKDGVELLIHARVTVRTNLDLLIGGASDATVVARVGQGIITAVGSAKTHMEVLVKPELISKGLARHALSSNTAYEIVSVDIARIDIGENVGARLQTVQAAADMQTAQARAEGQLAEAKAYQQEMKALIVERRAELLLAEAEIPSAMAYSIRAGHIRSRSRADAVAHRLRLATPPRGHAG